jgi:hypothetical protein
MFPLIVTLDRAIYFMPDKLYLMPDLFMTSVRNGNLEVPTYFLKARQLSENGKKDKCI